MLIMYGKAVIIFGICKAICDEVRILDSYVGVFFGKIAHFIEN